jgi:hypothetical protein
MGSLCAVCLALDQDQVDPPLLNRSALHPVFSIAPTLAVNSHDAERDSH